MSNHWLQPIRDGPAATATGSLMWKQPYHEENGASTSTDSSSASNVGKWRHKLEYLKEMIVGVDLLIVATIASIMTFGVNLLGSEWLSFISDSKPASLKWIKSHLLVIIIIHTNIVRSKPAM